MVHSPLINSLYFQQYSIDEKLEIIDFAKNNGNRAAGREYNVAESSIREWRKNEAKLRYCPYCIVTKRCAIFQLAE